jgi:sulfotransferase
MKVKKIYFINGMPRSGSTLLSNILAQNPRFHVTPTSGLSELVYSIHQFWKKNSIIKASETPEKQLAIIKDLFQSYHQDTDRPIVFNKSRGWAPIIELVENSLGRPIKILTTTRKITNILASMEKLYRKEIKNINSPMDMSPQMQTLEGRLSVWTAQDGLVGSAFNSIRDAVMRGHEKKFHFVDFEKLTTQPELTLKYVYDFLDEGYFKHDFNNVQQYTKENDAEHGFSDLHTIRPKVEPVKDDSQEILGYTWEQFQNFHFNF